MSHFVASRPSRISLTLVALICVGGGLAGCGGATVAPTASATATPTATDDATPVNEEPGVAITFDLDGEEHVVRGFPDRGFCNPDGSGMLFATTDPQNDAGAGFQYEKGGTTSVTAYVAADFAVQFIGEGAVTSSTDSDGTTTYSLAQAEGRAGVLPRDPGSHSPVEDFDLQQGDYVPATASFALTCPAE